MGVTPKQREVYDFLRAYHKAYRVYPTYREIAEGKINGEQVIARRSSMVTIQRMVKSLVDRGWIEKQPYVPRAYLIL